MSLDLSLGFFTAVPNTILRGGGGLTLQARFLYALLLSYADRREKRLVVYPRVDTLAREIGVSESTVKRALKELVDSRWVERKRQMGRSTLTYINAAPIEPTQGSNRPVAETTDESAKEEPVKKSHTPSADKPREESSDNPTETEAPRERVIVPAEETVPYRPLARPKKPPDPKYHAIGARARRLWAQIVVPAAPPLATWSPATLVKAGKTVAGLKDTPFAGKTLEELMPTLVARIKSCNPLVRKSVNFGWLFCADAPNLARMLAGDWDTGAGEVEEPKRRAIPQEDYWAGMDEAAYWRKKDKGE